MTPNPDIVLACHSGEMNKYHATPSIVGFAGPVEATLGGLVVSYLLGLQDRVVKTAYEHIVEIADGEVSPESLDLSLAEITYWTAIFLLSTLAYYASNPLTVTNPTWVQLRGHHNDRLAAESPARTPVGLPLLLAGAEH